jgi:chemotaxis response regulator CheB
MRLVVSGPAGAAGPHGREPIRVMLVDPDAASGAPLGRAIDLCPDMALVSFARDLRRAASEAIRCAPDVVAIRLPADDERCADLMRNLAGLGTPAAVVVLGAARDRDGDPVDPNLLLERLRSVAVTGGDEIGPGRRPN